MGIGEHLAETFAAEGVNLHLTARSTDKLDALRARIRAAFDVEVTLHSADLAEPGACEALSDAVGTVDILVNNACHSQWQPVGGGRSQVARRVGPEGDGLHQPLPSVLPEAEGGGRRGYHQQHRQLGRGL